MCGNVARLFHDVFVINGRDIVTSTQITGIASPRKRGVREGRDTLIPAKFQDGELADPARGQFGIAG